MRYEAEQYTYRVFYSFEDEEYVGKVAEFPSLSVLEEDRMAAFEGITEAVRFNLDDMERNGEVIPEPLCHRQYSGKVSLRMTPELHREIAIAAQEQGVSINRLINARLALA